MTASVLIALVGLVLTVATTVFTIGKIIGAFTVKITAEVEALKQLVMFRLDSLESKQDKYNHMQERLAKNEASSASAHHRIDTLESRVNAAYH